MTGAGLHALQVLAGLAALGVGAHWLVGAATEFAQRLGVSPLLVGITVVAIGTSLPELFIGVFAAYEGHAGISLGNVVGANALNVGLILGLTAMISPLRVGLRVLRWDVPVMLGSTALLVWLALQGTIGRLPGALMLAGMAAYLVLNVRLAREERRSRAAHDFAHAIEAGIPADPLRTSIAKGAVGMVALGVGAQLTIDGALGLATLLGLSQSVIALTLVSVGTTLPELVVATVAALRGQGDIAFGNVIGSNINNVLTVVGASAVVRPLETGDITAPALLALLALSAFIVPVMWRGFTIVRWEGALLIAAYAGFLAVALSA